MTPVPVMLPLNPELEAVLRMGLAVLCGLVVGFNRSHHAGTARRSRVRVHVLVGLSACLMVLAAGPDPQARSRVIQGVAAGVGFLGAGEILTRPRLRPPGPPEVHGLTSAAAIWFTAALGVTVAASTPELAALALLLALITLSHRDGATPAEASGSGPPGAHPSGDQNRKRSPSRLAASDDSGRGQSASQ